MKAFIFKHMAFLLVLMAGVLIWAQCDGRQESDEPINCTHQFVTIGLKLKYSDGQPVLLDSCKVFWKSKNRILEQNLSCNEFRIYGGFGYGIVNDNMKNELENKQEIMHFTGYLNDEIIHQQDVLVGADACHVNYLGTEPLTQTIYGISDVVRESKFCELVNNERIRGIIPSFNAFRYTINETVSYENKLQMIVDWFLSHNCITDARVDCVLCVPTYQGYPNNSRIVFSFVENGQTVDMIMLVTGDNASFAGFISD